MQINFNKVFKDEIKKVSNLSVKPKLLLHVCCAPCLSGVIDKIKDFFDITLFFYNPNISPKEEFDLRLNEVKALLEKINLSDIKVALKEYDNFEFEEIADGLKSEKEGGLRCKKCYQLRLEKTFEYARLNNFDFVTTTLSVSPYKNANLLNELGVNLSEKYGVKYLVSDFKKDNGYKMSCDLSKKFGLYRQNYCGCVYSKKEADNRISISIYDKITPDAKKIREEVFIKEQGFVSEYDDIDKIATHFVAFRKGEPVATLRLFLGEDKKSYVLGRLAVKKELRGEGIGSLMVNKALNHVKNKGALRLILHSQLSATDFYKKLGFIEYSSVEYEENCPHIWMEKIL